MSRSRVFFMSLAGCLLLAVLPAFAQEVDIPPQDDPGAVLNGTLQNIRRQETQPWLYRPVEPGDYEAPETPPNLIEWKGGGPPESPLPINEPYQPLLRIH